MFQVSLDKLFDIYYLKQPSGNRIAVNLIGHSDVQSQNHLFHLARLKAADTVLAMR